MQVSLVIIISLVLAMILGSVLSRSNVRSTLTGLVVHAVAWSQYIVIRILPQMAGFMASTISASMLLSRGIFLTLASSLVSDITGEAFPAPRLGEDTFQGGLARFGRAMAAAFNPVLEATLAPARPLSPDEARERVGALLGLSTTLQLQDWWAHAVLEMGSFGQYSYLADFSGALERGFGVNTLGRSVMRRLFTLSIAGPLETYFHRLYSPTGLTTAQAVNAWQKGLLDDDAALTILADHGYRHDRALLLLNLEQRDFTLDQAEQLWRLGQLDDGKLRQIVGRQGYGEVRADLVHTLVRSKRSLSLLEEIADVGRKLYREGLIEQPALRELLHEAHYRDPEIDLVLVREELARRDAKQLTKSEIMAAFEAGVLTEVEARDRLRGIAYGDDEIDILLATQQRRLSPSQVIDALTRGILDAHEAHRRLAAAGYRDEDIEVLIDLRVRRLSMGQVVDALTRGLLNVQGAREQLRRLNFDADTIDLLLAFQQKSLSPSDIQGALLRGLLTEGEARARLRQIGYSDDDAELLLRLRFQLLSAGEVLDAYESGLLIRVEARERLQALGFSLEDAGLILQTFEQKVIRQGKPRPRS